jgi:hypothetical protein
VETITMMLASTTAEFSEDAGEAYVPAHARAMMKRQADLWAVDAEWCEATAERIESGDLAVGPELTPEQVRHWREAIKSERFPEEVARWREQFK